ncbi:hypothetical protein BCR42DRAFT_496814 [Absidia repens]|uniref:Uncharacterized protein n=1 Tax=Absidia repens TaxID=90262 RepID=A0A1X2HXY8_9FUNG|nr:hypothetical protein BCR42DRAFT_496814 [Absidia repens]
MAQARKSKSRSNGDMMNQHVRLSSLSVYMIWWMHYDSDESKIETDAGTGTGCNYISHLFFYNIIIILRNNGKHRFQNTVDNANQVMKNNKQAERYIFIITNPFYFLGQLFIPDRIALSILLIS